MSDEIQKCLHNAFEHAKPYCGQGRVANYIPALAEVDPSKFGMAVALPNGESYAVGDADEPFSIQSVSKFFTLSLALERLGDDLWNSVGREPSGSSWLCHVNRMCRNFRSMAYYTQVGAVAEFHSFCDWARNFRSVFLEIR